MVQVLSLEPVAMPSAGEYWRYTELREPFDVLADEFVVSLTAGGEPGWTTDRRCSKGNIGHTSVA